MFFFPLLTICEKNTSHLLCNDVHKAVKLGVYLAQSISQLKKWAILITISP